MVGHWENIPMQRNTGHAEAVHISFEPDDISNTTFEVVCWLEVNNNNSDMNDRHTHGLTDTPTEKGGWLRQTRLGRSQSSGRLEAAPDTEVRAAEEPRTRAAAWPAMAAWSWREVWSSACAWPRDPTIGSILSTAE